LSLCVNSKVCKSMDIRNHPEMLERLRGCTAIQGYLQIGLMELGMCCYLATCYFTTVI
jgi:acyl-CoA hydrolase